MCAVWVAAAPWKPVHHQLWHRVGRVTWCPPSRRSRSIPFPPPAGDLLCSRVSRPCGDGLSVRSTCGFLPLGEGRPHARRDLLVGDSHLFRLWPHDIKKKKKKGAEEAREWCQVLEMPGSGASPRAPGGERPRSPQTRVHPRDPGALGLGPASLICEPLPGAWRVSAWGASLCPHLCHLRSSRVGSGIQAVRWD